MSLAAYTFTPLALHSDRLERCYGLSWTGVRSIDNRTDAMQAVASVQSNRESKDVRYRITRDHRDGRSPVVVFS